MSSASRATVPRVGVIGLGYWGRNLVRNVAALGALEAMCDPSPEARAAQTALYPGVDATDDAGAIFADPRIEAVMIATPAVTHGALAAAALAAGKHVFVEKPLCLDVAEAGALRDDAARRGRVLMVGHLLHYHPAFNALKDLVARGSLGRLRYIYSHRLSLGKIRREENALWSFAPHDISMILALIGAMPERVSADGAHFLTHGVADTTLTHFSFPAGEQAHVFVSWLHPYKDQRLVVVGEEGMGVFNDVVSGPEKLMLYRHAVGWNGDIPVLNKAEGEPIPYAAGEPLKRECEAFFDAVRGGARPPSDAEEGIRVLAVLEACQRALETRAPAMLAGKKDAP